MVFDNFSQYYERRIRTFVRDYMKIRFLNKNIENKTFDYSPRYYDERKERLDKKKELYRRMQSGELTDIEKREMMRDQMRDKWSRTHYRKSQQKSSNIRVLVLILILIALGYFVFNGVDEIESIIHIFDK